MRVSIEGFDCVSGLGISGIFPAFRNKNPLREGGMKSAALTTREGVIIDPEVIVIMPLIRFY